MQIFAVLFALAPALSPVCRAEDYIEKYKEYEHAIYLGRDTAYPVAMEGALKLKEVSYVDANAYAFGELKHGPLALVDDRFFEMVLLPAGMLYDKAVSNIQEVLARGGHVIVVTNVREFDLPVESVIRLETKIKIFAPLNKLIYKKRTDFFSLPSFTHKSKFAIFGIKRTKTPKFREKPHKEV